MKRVVIPAFVAVVIAAWTLFPRQAWQSRDSCLSEIGPAFRNSRSCKQMKIRISAELGIRRSVYKFHARDLVLCMRSRFTFSCGRFSIDREDGGFAECGCACCRLQRVGSSRSRSHD